MQVNDRQMDDEAAEMVHLLLALHDRKGIIREADVKKALPRLSVATARRNLIKEAGRRLYRTFGLKVRLHFEAMIDFIIAIIIIKTFNFNIFKVKFDIFSKLNRNDY